MKFIREDAKIPTGTDGIVEKHIDVLDGIRAISISLVVWFHFWQQSWLTPYINFNTKFTKYLGISKLYLADYVRYGYDFVDMLILLSAVCNFYPYARAILLKEEWPDWLTFYKKRACRIMPSYYFNVVIVFVIALLTHSYEDKAFMFRDLLGRLTFFSIYNKTTYLYSKLNPVLWTVQVEVFYYLLMPVIAYLVKKKPYLTILGMWLVGLVSTNYILMHKSEQISFYVNHFLTFAGCYASGILVCMLYILLKKAEESRYKELAATVLFFVSVAGIHYMFDCYAGTEDKQLVQLSMRNARILFFSLFILSVMFAAKWIRIFFANRIMRFVSVISYNLYIWHQIIAVWLKQCRIPYWGGRYTSEYDRR